MERLLNKCVYVLFSILMLLIAVATLVLDKNVENPFPNTVTYANSAYYLLAIVGIMSCMFIYRSLLGTKDISDRLFRVICIGISFIVFFCWQLPVGNWIYWYTNAGDFGSIMYAAIGFNNGETFADWTYFLQSPNNANLAIALSWVYKVLNDWRLILILGALLTNVSAVLVAVTIKNISKNRFAGICALIVAELLMAMTWRAFLVYTDNYGMLFIALIICIYTSELHDKYKMPIITVLATCGTFIKATIFIVYLAIIIHKGLELFGKSHDFKTNLKKMICSGVFAVIAFGIMIYGQNALRTYHGLDLMGQYPKSWQYMFMVGQNTEMYGVTNSVDPAIRDRLIVEALANGEDNEYVKNSCLNEGINRVRSRGIIGNVKFYIKKMNVAYNDGYFHNVQTNASHVSNELEKNWIYDILEKENGKYYQAFATVLQVAWDAVLFLLMLSVVLLKKNETYTYFQICILGITLYLMLFEGRSKYIYMFLPIYIVAAGLSFAELDKFTLKARKALDLIENAQKEKKVGVITFHFVNNFGGALQAYALQRAVSEQCNVKTEIIDYRNLFITFTDFVRLFPISTNVNEIITGLKTMKTRFGRKKRFHKFVNENCNLTEKYWSNFKMNRKPPVCEKYICGSDQIWNPFITMGVASNYFLNFESDSKKKIAYAPSFGSSSVASIYKNKVKRYVEDIEYLSVREEAGQNLIKELTGREAEKLIDPTFLLEKKQWEEITTITETNEPFVLLYIMQQDNEVYEYARKVKEELGIKLVEISRYGYAPEFVDEVLVDVGPKEFLGLFKDSAYVCTNSYHGLAFSIIFEKEFCLIPCKRFTARIDNMVELLQLGIGKNGANIDELTVKYDKNFVDNIIKEEREKAIHYLRESVGDL